MLPRRCAMVSVLVGGLCLVPEARAQDAFGLEPGLSAGALHDPITGHSPWQTASGLLQGGTYFGYASDPVYACEMDASGACTSALQPWVENDWMTTAQVAGHFLDGRLSAEGAVRTRLSSGTTADTPDALRTSTTYDQGQWEDLRLSGRWAFAPTQRLALAPMASLRIDRQTHIITDSNDTPQLDLSPLYGLGNSIGVAVPVGFTAQAWPLHLSLEPELARMVSETETHSDAASLGLNPLVYWARARAAGAWTVDERLALLAEAEGRLREDAIRSKAIVSAEWRVGARYAPRKQRLQISALVGRSPFRALGSPGFRGGLSVRWTGRPDDVADSALPSGPSLRLMVRAPDGSILPVTVDLDDQPAATIAGADGSVVLPLADDQPHTLTIRSPGHATLRQVVRPTTEPEQRLERTLPLGGGDGILTIDVRDPEGTPLSTVQVEYSRADQAEAPPVDLGEVCGDCALTYSELPTGPYVLALDALGMKAGTVPLDVTPTPPDAPDDILFLAPPVGQLAIQVRDENGSPIPDAAVELIHPTNPTKVSLDPSGDATLIVAPGDWQVVASAPGRVRQAIDVAVEPLVPMTHSLFINLIPAEETRTDLVVEVYDADGFPVSGANIFSEDRHLSTTNTGGRIRIEDLPVGPLPLRVEHPDFHIDPGWTSHLVAGEETTAVVALGWKPGALKLRVTTPDGAPVDSKILLQSPSRSILERTGPDGLYSEILEPGPWRVRLADADHLPIEVPFEIKPSQNSGIDLQLMFLPRTALPDTETAGFAVTLEDETGSPIDGAMVYLGQTPLGTTSLGTISVGEGIPTGTTKLGVQAPYFDPWQARVDMEGEIQNTVEARLQSPLGRVRLVAVDPQDKAIEAQVRITGEGGLSRVARLHSDGTRTFRLAHGYWEFAFASKHNGFGVEDLEIEREISAYEVRWVGYLDAAPAPLSLASRRPVTVQLWSRPANAPTSGTLRLLGPEVLPPFEVGDNGTWNGHLRPGEWETLATAPDLGIGGDELVIDPGVERLSTRVELGSIEVELTEAEVSIDDTLYFSLGSADLAPEAQDSLQAVARTLRSHPEVRRVRVEGHADRSGSADQNLALSEQRARAVEQALVELGVESHRLASIGYGETRPVPVEHLDGEARNRRVVFRVIERTAAVQVTGDSGQ